MATIKSLVEKGAALYVFKQRVLDFPAIVESLEPGPTLFWVNMFPNDQSSIHERDYDEMIEVGDVGLEFRLKGSSVAYLALYDEWDDVEILDSREQKAVWESKLEDETEGDRFKQFVSDYKDLRLSLIKERVSD